MEILDANVVLRYLLKDQEEFYSKSRQLIERRNLYIPSEVVAEIVYVLEKVYEVPRVKIKEALELLLKYPNIMTSNTQVFYEAFAIYSTENIDFVDSILVGYHRVHNHLIHTFDAKVKKLCKDT